MITKLFRYSFICAIFVSGVVIGSIFTPEISTVSDAENHQIKEKSQESKPTKRKPSRKQTVVQLGSGITHN